MRTTESAQAAELRAAPGRGMPQGVASVLGWGRQAWLRPFDLAIRAVGLRYSWIRALFEHGPPPLLAMVGRLRAERAAWRATRRVPAYRAHLDSLGVDVSRLVPAAIAEAREQGRGA